MREIDVTTVRQKFGTLLDEVFYKGETVIILRKGKQLAKLAPLEDTETTLSDERVQLLTELHSLPAAQSSDSPRTILTNIRTKHAEKLKQRYGQ